MPGAKRVPGLGDQGGFLLVGGDDLPEVVVVEARPSHRAVSRAVLPTFSVPLREDGHCVSMNKVKAKGITVVVFEEEAVFLLHERLRALLYLLHAVF